MLDLTDLQHLAIAAAIGFLIGFQREWRAAEEAKSRSFAGARTFAFVALVGGLAGLVGDGPLLVAVGFGGVAALTVAAYWAEARSEPGTGGTTEIAILATYLLGVLTTRGEPALAAAGGVGAAILLALKPLVERWTKAIDEREIGAALRFLALTVIILPILPDQAYGPY
ncbi:MAG: MgtC/SapB family protein, partial [Parvularculaceae bacterium]